MRTLLLLGLLALPLLSTGCGSDDPPPPTYVYDDSGDVILVDEFGNPI